MSPSSRTKPSTPQSGGTSLPRVASSRSRKLPDPNIPDGQGSVMITLNRDVALRGGPVFRIRHELARLDFRLPIRASELVLEELLPVQPVLDGVALDDDQRRVPLIGGLHDSGG